MSCVAADELTLLVDGELDAERVARIEAHCQECTRCAVEVARARALVTGIAAEAPWYRDAARRARIVAAAVASAPQPRRSWDWRWGWLLVTGVAAASLVLVLAPTREESTLADPGFQARGAETPAAAGVGLRVYRLSGAGTEPVDTTVGAADALLFAYSNLEPDRFRWLTIVGVDALGTLHWYHPARPEGAGGVTAIRLASEAPAGELHEAVRRRLPAGRLVFVGIFAAEPLAAADVEVLATALAAGGVPVHAGATTVMLRLTVAPDRPRSEP